MVRRSVSSVWKNVSDDFHSSASVPPDDHMVVPPVAGWPPVAADSCWRAPMRSASAPVALSRLSGPMTPGCCGSSNVSLTLQLPRSHEAAMMLAVTPQRARYLMIIISVSSSVGLVMKVHAQREVRSLAAGGVRVLDVRLRVVGLRVGAGVIGPQGQVASGERQRRIRRSSRRYQPPRQRPRARELAEPPVRAILQEA